MKKTIKRKFETYIFFKIFAVWCHPSSPFLKNYFGLPLSYFWFLFLIFSFILYFYLACSLKFCTFVLWIRLAYWFQMGVYWDISKSPREKFLKDPFTFSRFWPIKCGSLWNQSRPGNRLKSYPSYNTQLKTVMTPNFF